MTSTKCIFGCTNVRYGARIIAVFNFWFGVTLMIGLLSELNSFNEDFSYSYYDLRIKQISYDFFLLNQVFLTFIFLYINYYLKDSTYNRKVHKIHLWLTINTIFLSFYMLAAIFVAIKDTCPKILYFFIPVGTVHLYQIYVVKCFYDDELDSTLVADLTDCTAASRCYVRSVGVSNSSDVTVGRRPVAVPNSVYLVVTGKLDGNRGYPAPTTRTTAAAATATTVIWPPPAPEQRSPDYDPPAYTVTDGAQAQRT